MTNSKRYCSIKESLTISCKEVKAMRDGKLPKTTWAEYLNSTEKKTEVKKANI